MRKKLPYTEGDYVYLPLHDRKDTYGLGLIARIGRGAMTLGYFFGVRLSAVPTTAFLTHLRTEHAILVCCFGNRNIRNGRWKVIPKLVDFDRLAWPIPTFGNFNEIDRVAWRVTLNERLEYAYKEQALVDEVSNLPDDLVYGAEAVEISLARLLATGMKGTVGSHLP